METIYYNLAQNYLQSIPVPEGPGWRVATAEDIERVTNSDAVVRDRFKADRAEEVARITVTTASGNTFDGDENSQGRMARAILGLQSQPEGSTVQWVLHDNTVVDVGIAELQEALTLAGLRQTELWVQA